MMQEKRWTHAAWLLPLAAMLLVGSLLYFAQRSKQQRTDSDLARVLVRQRIDSMLAPLKLTAAHFASISPGIPLPEETILRHFRFLQDLGDCTGLALVTADQRVLAHLGDDADLLSQAVRQRTPGAAFLQPLTRAGELSALLLGVPLPQDAGGQWIVGTVPIDRLTRELPSFVRLRVDENPSDSPVHPLLPLLSVGVMMHERPVWPLLLGVLMLFGGIVLLIVLANRISGNPRPQPQEKN